MYLNSIHGRSRYWNTIRLLCRHCFMSSVIEYNLFLNITYLCQVYIVLLSWVGPSSTEKEVLLPTSSMRLGFIHLTIPNFFLRIYRNVLFVTSRYQLRYRRYPLCLSWSDELNLVHVVDCEVVKVKGFWSSTVR